jgi:hypothetical protein
MPVAGLGASMPEGVGGGGFITPESGGADGGAFGFGRGGGFTSPARNAASLSAGGGGWGLMGLFTRPVESAMNQDPPIQICTPGLYGPIPIGRGTKGGGVGAGGAGGGAWG